MRKSSRETKKTEVFTFSEGDHNRLRSDESDDEDLMDSSQSQQKKRALPTSKRNNNATSLLGEFEFSSWFQSNLMEYDCISECVSSNKNFGAEISEWIDSYKVKNDSDS